MLQREAGASIMAYRPLKRLAWRAWRKKSGPRPVAAGGREPPSWKPLVAAPGVEPGELFVIAAAGVEGQGRGAVPKSGRSWLCQRAPCSWDGDR